MPIMGSPWVPGRLQASPVVEPSPGPSQAATGSGVLAAQRAGSCWKHSLQQRASLGAPLWQSTERLTGRSSPLGDP